MPRETGIARRYAQALFLAARAADRVDRAAEDMAALAALDAHDPSLRLFLESPQVRDDHKHATVDAVLGPLMDPLTVEFVHVLLRKKRFPHVVDIAHEFEALIEKHRGIEQARVTTAVPLTEDETQALVRELEALTAKKIRLLARVEPDILGGVVVRIGDRIIDRSVRSLLSQLKEDLLAVEV